MTPLLFFAGTLIAAAPQPRGVEQAIDAIRRDFKGIRSRRSSMEKQEKVLLCLSAEGASVTAYRDRGKVKQISVEALGETGKRLFDFYYRDGKLFFAFAQQIDYGGHIMDELAGKTLRNDVVEEDRLYFDNRKLVRWLRSKKQMPPSHPDYASKGSSALAQAQSLLLFMNAPPPKEGEDHCGWACCGLEEECFVREACR